MSATGVFATVQHDTALVFQLLRVNGNDSPRPYQPLKTLWRNQGQGWRTPPLPLKNTEDTNTIMPMQCPARDGCEFTIVYKGNSASFKQILECRIFQLSIPYLLLGSKKHLHHPWAKPREPKFDPPHFHTYQEIKKDYSDNKINQRMCKR